MIKTILVLDLDGVLITNPSWRADKADTDGYSCFNMQAVQNLNKLLSLFEFDIWLSSTRRKTRSLSEFNTIFKNRQIQQKIVGFLPVYSECKNRKEEIEKFILEKRITYFLILDDDKTLRMVNNKIKHAVVYTELMKGFDDEKLKEALIIMENRKNKI